MSQLDCQRIHFETIDSTNTWAKQQIESFASDTLTIVTADFQTSGRGRFKRSWVAPANVNLLVSFCLKIPLTPFLGNIPQVLALSVCKSMPDIPIHLKWPNDIILDDKKMGGILCETVQVTGGIGVVVGIGLNVNMTVESLQQVDIPATSLLAHSGIAWDRELLLDRLTHCFKNDLTFLLKEGFGPFLSTYRQKLQINKSVSIQDGTRRIQGSFQAIDDQGGLILRLADGSLKTLYTGEIVPEVTDAVEL